MSEYSVVPAEVTNSAAEMDAVAASVGAVGGAVQGASGLPGEAAVFPNVAFAINQFGPDAGARIEVRGHGIGNFADKVRRAAANYAIADQDAAESYQSVDPGLA